MRNRAKNPDVVAEIMVKHGATPEDGKRLDALLQKLDQVMVRIDVLEATLDKQQTAPGNADRSVLKE